MVIQYHLINPFAVCRNLQNGQKSNLIHWNISTWPIFLGTKIRVPPLKFSFFSQETGGEVGEEGGGTYLGAIPHRMRIPRFPTQDDIPFIVGIPTKTSIKVTGILGLRRYFFFLMDVFKVCKLPSIGDGCWKKPMGFFWPYWPFCRRKTGFVIFSSFWNSSSMLIRKKPVIFVTFPVKLSSYLTLARENFSDKNSGFRILKLAIVITLQGTNMF